jgi:hypothetical protein
MEKLAKKVTKPALLNCFGEPMFKIEGERKEYHRVPDKKKIKKTTNK